MVKIEITHDEVSLRVLGWHVLWTFKKQLRFKRAHLQSVYLAEPSLRPPWFRCPGTHVPKLITAGTYWGKAGKEFWDTTYSRAPLVIELIDEAYTRVVVDVAEPEAVLKILRK